MWTDRNYIECGLSIVTMTKTRPLTPPSITHNINIMTFWVILSRKYGIQMNFHVFNIQDPLYLVEHYLIIVEVLSVIMWKKTQIFTCFPQKFCTF